MIADTIAAAVRGVLRAPRATIVTMLCVATGVAASATALTLAWTLTFRALPFPNADRLARVWLASETASRLDLSIPDIADVAREVSAFDAVAGTARTRFVALFNAQAVRLRGEAVSDGYFELLGVKPSRGRVFSSADHQGGVPRVALISHATWVRYYGGDSSVIGALLRTERATFTIVGVLAAGFEGSIENDVVEFWVPLSQYEPAMLATDRTTRQSWIIGRLAPGQTLAAATAQLDGLTRARRASHPDSYRHVQYRAEAFGENWRGSLRSGGTFLLGAALVLLVIAVVNVSALALARAAQRRREFALRASLGAPASRIVLLPLIETAIAAGAGGLIGVAVTPWVIAFVLRAAPVQIPAYLAPRFGGVVVVLVAALCVTIAIVAGILPAREARRAGLGATLRSGGRGHLGERGHARLGRVLVGAQVALSTLLVCLAVLLGRAYQSVLNAPLGFRTDIARFAMSASPSDTTGGIGAHLARVKNAARAVPGAQHVALAWVTLPPWNPESAPFAHNALGDVQPEHAPRLSTHGVDEDAFPTLGMQMLAGRAISLQDQATSEPVVVISESLARRLGGTERAAQGVLDTQLRVTDPGRQIPAEARIVGVVSDVAWDGIGEQDTGRMIQWNAAGDPATLRYDAYYAIPQIVGAGRLISIAVRGAGDPAALLDGVTRAISSAAPRSAVHWVSTMEDELAVEYRQATFALYLSGAFAVGALALAMTGLFALLAHTVARRVPEIGVRLALGASPARVKRDVLLNAMVIVAAGAFVGGVAALVAARALGQLRYDVPATDPISFALAAAALVVTGAIAAWIPARRASRVSAMEALRRE